MPSWDAQQYLRFQDERTRPCRDLVARIALSNPRRVIDLGCGPGNSTAVLAERWPGAQITGLDSSPEMISAARQKAPRLTWQAQDIAAWADETGDSFDLVFSNAALQWVGQHDRLMPKLFARVAPGGALAVQMPGNLDAPAHRIMRDLAAAPPWRERFPREGVRNWHVHDLPFYYDLLAPLAQTLDLWETEYLHIMPDAAAIVEWYKGTGLRPYLDALAGDTQRAEFCQAYLQLVQQAYPARRDGRVIFPFRRPFLIAYQRAA